MAIQNDYIFLDYGQEGSSLVSSILSRAASNGMRHELVYLPDINKEVRGLITDKRVFQDIARGFNTTAEEVEGWFSLEPVHKKETIAIDVSDAIDYSVDGKDITKLSKEGISFLAKRHKLRLEPSSARLGRQDIIDILSKKTIAQLMPYLGLGLARASTRKYTLVEVLNKLQKDNLASIYDSMYPITEEYRQEQELAYLYSIAEYKPAETVTDTYERLIVMYPSSFEMKSVFTESDRMREDRMILGLILTKRMGQSPTKRGASYAGNVANPLTLNGPELASRPTGRFRRTVTANGSGNGIIDIIDIARQYLRQESGKAYLDQYWDNVTLGVRGLSAMPEAPISEMPERDEWENEEDDIIAEEERAEEDYEDYGQWEYDLYYEFYVNYGDD